MHNEHLHSPPDATFSWCHLAGKDEIFVMSQASVPLLKIALACMRDEDAEDTYQTTNNTNVVVLV